MKKKLVSLLVCLTMLSCILIPYSAFAAPPAVSENLLNGATYTNSSTTDPVNLTYSSTMSSHDVIDLVDNTWNNYSSLQWYFKLETAVNAKTIKLYATSSTTLILYNSAGVEVSRKTFSAEDANFYSISVNDVKYLSFSAAGSVGTFFLSAGSDTAAPATPIGLVGTPGEGQAVLSWTANNESDLSGYKIYKDGIYLATVTAPTTTYTVTGLTNGATYTFEVTAVDTSNNESTKSNAVQVTPEAPETTRALLTLYLSNGQVKEYDLSSAQLDTFLSWYDSRADGTGPAKYAFTKTWNKGPFKTRTEYVIFDKIVNFDVDEYEVEEE